MIIGITGSIATGKTYVEKMIKSQGYQVIDADHIAHQALYRKTEGYKKTVSAFGTTILNKNQSINRHRLGQIVFLNPDKKKLLENLVHPFVIDKIKQMILKKGQKELLFISVPLLYEVEMEFLFDYIIVVYVSQAKQIERLMNRDRINKDLAFIKIASQMPLEVKKRKADFVIDNEADGQTQLAKQIEKILQEIKEKANEI